MLGAVGPIPLRARKAEALLMGQQVSEELIQEVAIMAAKSHVPLPTKGRRRNTAGR